MASAAVITGKAATNAAANMDSFIKIAWYEFFTNTGQFRTRDDASDYCAVSQVAAAS